MTTAQSRRRRCWRAKPPLLVEPLAARLPEEDLDDPPLNLARGGNGPEYADGVA